MTKNDIIGHWYECIKPKCNGRVPIPKYAFERGVGIVWECSKCGNSTLFQFSHRKMPCSKEEALRHFKIEQQIKDGEIRFIAYWQKDE